MGDHEIMLGHLGTNAEVRITEKVPHTDFFISAYAGDIDKADMETIHKATSPKVLTMREIIATLFYGHKIEEDPKLQDLYNSIYKSFKIEEYDWDQIQKLVHDFVDGVKK